MCRSAGWWSVRSSFGTLLILRKPHAFCHLVDTSPEVAAGSCCAGNRLTSHRCDDYRNMLPCSWRAMRELAATDSGSRYAILTSCASSFFGNAMSGAEMYGFPVRFWARPAGAPCSSGYERANSRHSFPSAFTAATNRVGFWNLTGTRSDSGLGKRPGVRHPLDPGMSGCLFCQGGFSDGSGEGPHNRLLTRSSWCPGLFWFRIAAGYPLVIAVLSARACSFCKPPERVVIPWRYDRFLLECPKCSTR